MRLLVALVLCASCSSPKAPTTTTPPPPPPVAEVEIVVVEGPAAGRACVIDVVTNEEIATLDATLGDKRPATQGRAGGLRLYFPVDLEEARTPLPLELTLELKNGARAIERRRLDVRAVTYKTSKLKVNKRFVDLPKKLKARVAKERANIDAVLHADPGPALWQLPMTRPATKRRTSRFGTKRLYNNKKESRHRGLDIDGRTGDPITAALDGRVVLVEQRYYSGGTIVLDHGERLFTLYFHQSKFHVAAGDTVRAGQRIGNVGKTGRVTGAHLHFGVKLDGLYIDPEQWARLFRLELGVGCANGPAQLSALLHRVHHRCRALCPRWGEARRRSRRSDDRTGHRSL